MTSPLSFTGRRWHLPSTQFPGGRDLVEYLAYQRQLSLGTAPAEWVLAPPDMYPDMPKAVARLRRAFAASEPIGIFGDYDCDGITATAQLVRACRRRTLEPHVRLPHRVHDGYGLQQPLVQELIQRGISLLITVDTGVSAVTEIAVLQAAGIDVIVTDHHALGEEIPPAYAVLHPALAPDLPEPYPSGSGVAHALVRALEERPWEDDHTDRALAMIGTVGDVVPLLGENRTLVQRGLHALRSLPAGSPLLQLLELTDVQPDQVTSTDIAFRVAPRINAAGRMDSPDLALQALLQGGEALQQLDTLNRSRQLATEEAVSMAAAQFEHRDIPPLLASLSPKYEHGIIGLVAGKLTESFGRPSLVATSDGTLCTASLRSPPGYDITAGLRRQAHLLERFGGHSQAAGCSVREENWSALCHALAEDVSACVQPADLVPSLRADALLQATELHVDFCETLNALEPYGQGNAEPLFLLQNVRLTALRTVGRDGNHLQARLGSHAVIGFHFGPLANQLMQSIDLLCRVQANEWRGVRRVQLQLVDARSAVSLDNEPRLYAQTGAKAPSI